MTEPNGNTILAFSHYCFPQRHGWVTFQLIANKTSFITTPTLTLVLIFYTILTAVNYFFDWCLPDNKEQWVLSDMLIDHPHVFFMEVLIYVFYSFLMGHLYLFLLVRFVLIFLQFHLKKLDYINSISVLSYSCH